MPIRGFSCLRSGSILKVVSMKLSQHLIINIPYSITALRSSPKLSPQNHPWLLALIG